MGHLAQPLCSGKVILEQIAQDFSQRVWLHTLSVQSVPVHSKVLDHILVELPMCQFFPIASCLTPLSTALQVATYLNAPIYCPRFSYFG